jgi:acetyl esterase/lipase
MKKIILVFSFILMFCVSKAQSIKVIDLYPKGVPNAKINLDYAEKADTAANGKIRVSKVIKPQLIAYYPAKPNGTSVIICPGGGYSILSISHEGYLIAQKFNEIGITAFVLKYRLPSELVMEDKSIGPLQDAQQAVKIVREKAVDFNINPAKIGIMGFSAGGHLASTLGTHFSKSVLENQNNTSLRPDFMILIYPVISFGEIAHNGSKNNLIGLNPSEEQVKLYSNELQVSAETPPTFLIHANDDKSVPSENSLNFAIKLKQAGVNCELHLYSAGGHGFGLDNKTTKDQWIDRLKNWMEASSLL